MGLTENLLAFVNDNTSKKSTKGAIVLLFIVLTLSVNHYIGYTFFSYQNSKIQAMKDIQELKKYELDSLSLITLGAMEKEIIHYKRNPVYHLWSSFFTIDTPINSNKNLNTVEQPINANTKTVEFNIYHKFLLIISCTYIWIMMILLSMSILFISSNIPLLDRIITALLLAITSIVMAYIYASIFSTVKIFDRIWINYLINFVGSGLLSGLLFFPFKKK